LGVVLMRGFTVLAALLVLLLVYAWVGVRGRM
jgi:hypothetical protein